MRMDILSENLSFPLKQNHLNRINIEPHYIFEHLVTGMRHTIQGLEEAVRLWTDVNDKMDLHKKADLIVSPFDLTFATNDFRKKLIQRLTPELEYENFTYCVNQGFSESLDLLEKVAVMSDYDIEFDPQIKADGLLKLLDVRLKEPEGFFRDKLCEYVLQSRNLLGKEIWIIANCDAYLNDGDEAFLEQFCYDEKILLISLKAGEKNNYPEHMPQDYVVDSDLCELYL